MNPSLETMLSAYDAVTPFDKKNAMKEVMQEIVLCGLSRAGFFSKAAISRHSTSGTPTSSNRLPKA